MRLVVQTLLVGLIMALASPATARVEVTLLEEDTRIVLPEAGMAVTIPAGWEVRTDRGGAIFETALAASPSGAPGACGVQVFRYHGATTQDVAEFLGAVYWDFDEFVVSDLPLPTAGYAVRLEGPGTSSPHPGTLVAYVFDAGDRYAWLWCDSTSADPPDDLWLSIADTIEFLPTEESASPERSPVRHTSEPTGSPSAEEPGSEPTSVLASLPGSPPEVETWSGPEWIARLDPSLPADASTVRRVEALVAAADASLDDLTITTALLVPSPGNVATVATVRIPGMRAFDLLDPVVGAMEPQIARPAFTWHRSADHLIARVYDATMPGVYPVTLYPVGDTVWVIAADMPLVEAIVAPLPTQLEPSGEAGVPLPCDALEEAFQRDTGPGNPELDRDYLERCVACDESIDLVTFHRVADVEMGLDILARRCDWHMGVPLVSESPSPAPLGAVVEGGPIERAGSGFSVTIPSDWAAEVAEPDLDYADQASGTAWEALRASAPDRSMACSLAVGVTEVPPGQWLTTGQDGVITPYWDPMDASTLWVPSPEVEGTRSVHMADWERRQALAPDLDRIVHYALTCAADDTRVGDPGRVFERLMASFELLPEDE